MSSVTNQPGALPSVPFRPLHNVLNSIDDMKGQGVLKGEIGARVANFFAGAPVAIEAVVTNALLALIQTPGVVAGLGARVVADVTKSQAFRDFQAKMPTPTDLLRTVARIVAFTIGSALCATLGVISPEHNFKALIALKLIRNKKADEATQEAEVQKIAQQALEQQQKVQKRNDQIATDLAVIEQLPHEEPAIVAPVIIAEVISEEEVVASESEVAAQESEVAEEEASESELALEIATASEEASEAEVASASEEAVASEEASASEEAVASEEASASEVSSEEQVSSEETLVAAKEETVVAQQQSKFAKVQAKLIEAKDFTLAHKYPLALTAVGTAAIGAIVFTDAVTLATEGVQLAGGTIVNGTLYTVGGVSNLTTSAIGLGASVLATAVALPGAMIATISEKLPELPSLPELPGLPELPSMPDFSSITAPVWSLFASSPASDNAIVADSATVPTPVLDTTPATV